jgi:hypothetical protein
MSDDSFLIAWAATTTVMWGACAFASYKLKSPWIMLIPAVTMGWPKLTRTKTGNGV